MVKACDFMFILLSVLKQRELVFKTFQIYKRTSSVNIKTSGLMIFFQFSAGSKFYGRKKLICKGLKTATELGF